MSKSNFSCSASANTKVTRFIKVHGRYYEDAFISYRKLNYPLQQNFCYSDPCPARNFLCQVGFTDKGYRCVCRDGFKGDNCEGMATLFNFAFSTVVYYRVVCVTKSTSRYFLAFIPETFSLILCNRQF